MSGQRDCDVCFMSYPFLPHEETEYGIGNYSYEIIRHLRGLGLNPRVLTVGDLPTHMWQWPSREIHFLRQLSTVHADVYHGVDAFSSKTAVMLRKRPLIATIHDLVAAAFTTQIGRLSYAYNELSMKLVRGSDSIVVPFKETKEQLCVRYRISPDKVKVIGYGVDHRVFRSSKNITRSKSQILYVGQLVRLKGLETLLRAFKMLVPKFADIELLIGGEGEHRSHFEYLAEQLGLVGNVKFVGFIPYRKLPEYYSRATVFVWPSLLGFGLTAVQAMACGLPVIAARTLDMPEFLADAGLLFEPGHHEELAETIALVLSDDRLHKDLSNRGLKKARGLSWEETAEETLALYQTLSRH